MPSTDKNSCTSSGPSQANIDPSKLLRMENPIDAILQGNGPQSQQNHENPSPIDTNNPQLLVSDKPSTVAALMPPPVGRPTKSRQTSSKVIVDEDTYLQSMGEIIERDFFPNLTKMRQLATSGEQISDLESLHSDSHSVSAKIPSERITLDQFHATYISEDNQSFEKLLEKDIKEKQSKFHWAFDSQANQGKQQQLMLYYLANKTLSIEDRQQLDHILDGKVSEDNNRPVAVDTWRYEVRNGLMFPPNTETIVPYHERKQQLLLEDKHMMKYAAKDVTKVIQHQNTMLASQGMGQQQLGYEAPHTPTSYASGSQWDEEYDELGKGNNNIYVPMTPQINPGVDMSPLMTWGDIIATPLPLSPQRSSAATNDFKILQVSEREQLGYQLSKRQRSSAGTDLSTPVSVRVPDTPMSVTSHLSKRSNHSIAFQASNKSMKSITNKLTPAGLALAKKLYKTKSNNVF